MKRYICLIISLCLVFGSFSFSYATATDWDTADQANLRAIKNLLDSGGTLYNQISNIASTTNTISNNINTIKGYLFDSGHGIAYWTQAISTWMSPIYNALTSIPVDTSTIIGALGYYDSYNTYHPFFNNLNNSLTNQYFTSAGNVFNSHLNAHTYFVDSNGVYGLRILQANGGYNDISVSWTQGSPLGNIAFLLKFLNENMAMAYNQIHNHGYYGYESPQNAVNWGNLGTSSFTPASQTDGIYKWLSAIQAPVARLSYVLASDERIAAQQAAALAEQEVVDDFIDPTGDSSATASDFGSISDLSSGYQQNFGSTASVSGIFDIFDSNNFGWFSSETYQQLDTTVAQRGSSFETPLLDQQLEDISRALGVDYAN